MSSFNPSDVWLFFTHARVKGFLTVSGMFVLLAGILWWMGRPVICTCGTVKLWQGDVFSPQVSQHLTDWYTLTHITHGILLFAILRRVWPEGSVLQILLIALAVEAGWEVIENTEYVIQYYRQQTMSETYVGDTMINSLGDLAAMGIGFLLAYQLPVYASSAAVVASEILLILVIRDSLLLNLLMFAYPLDSLKQWQMAPAVQSSIALAFSGFHR